MSLLSPGDIAQINDTVKQVANATLTTIQTPSAIAGNGDPGTRVTVWEGEARGFLQRQDRDVLSDGVQARVQIDTFILFDAEAGAHAVPLGSLRSGADWHASSVVIRDERLTPASLWRFTVTGLEHEADGTLDHVLLTLNAGTEVT